MNQVQLNTVINLLSEASDLLYQEDLKPAYVGLAAVFPQLEEVIMGVESEEEQAELTDKLKEALNAMETGDSTLLADVLQYDIIEQLKGYVEE